MTEKFDRLLRPLGITRYRKGYPVLIRCPDLVQTQPDRLQALQKEIYLPVADNPWGCAGNPLRASSAGLPRWHGRSTRNGCRNWQAIRWQSGQLPGRFWKCCVML